MTAKLTVPSAGSGQDRADVFETREGFVLVVADGAGGMGGGAGAAEQVITEVRRAVLAGKMPDPSAILHVVDRDLAAGAAGQTTAVVAIVSTSGVLGASVGDSGAWLVRPQDHVDLTSEQARKPLVGSGSARPLRFQCGAVDGTLVVASDGLFKYVEIRQLCSAVRCPDLAVIPDTLVRMVRLPSGALQDDVAIVVCREVH